MQDDTKLNRRTIIKAAAVGAASAASGAALAAGRPAEAAARKPRLSFRSADFYKGGKFDAEKAKDAVIKVMQYHGYPVFPDTKRNLWVSDYGLGQFTKVGLACNMFVNNEKERYMLLDIYLLPNQMLPEHWHEATAKNPVKMEGWLVRHGLAHIVGEGEPNLGKSVVIPRCHLNGTATVMHEVVAKPGMFVPLNRPGAHHWQFGGPEGAILSEVANVHDNDGVRHAEPKIVFP